MSKLMNQRVLTFLFAITITLIGSPANGDASEAVIAGWRLRIVEAGETCALDYAKGVSHGQLALQSAAPCRFVGQGVTPQTRAYADNTRTLAIVFGTRYQGKSFRSLLDRGIYCGTVSQGVVLTDQTVSLSRRVAEGGVRCEGSGVDAREFDLFDADRQ